MVSIVTRVDNADGDSGAIRCAIVHHCVIIGIPNFAGLHGIDTPGNDLAVDIHGIIGTGFNSDLDGFNSVADRVCFNARHIGIVKDAVEGRFR